MMKVLTKHLLIENQDFALITDKYEGRQYYGTIPYTEVNDYGNVKRKLNGFDMCVSFESITEAIKERTRTIRLNKLIEIELAKGFDMKKAIYNIVGTPEYEAIYSEN